MGTIRVEVNLENNIRQMLLRTCMNHKIILIIGLVLALVLLAGCVPKPISEIKNEQYVGKTVTVRGVVGISIKIGKLSGYTVSDGTGDIAVKSSSLPVEGSEVTVTGRLMKDTIFGYYILS